MLYTYHTLRTSGGSSRQEIWQGWRPSREEIKLGNRSLGTQRLQWHGSMLTMDVWATRGTQRTENSVRAKKSFRTTKNYASPLFFRKYNVCLRTRPIFHYVEAASFRRGASAPAPTSRITVSRDLGMVSATATQGEAELVLRSTHDLDVRNGPHTPWKFLWLFYAVGSGFRRLQVLKSPSHLSEVHLMFARLIVDKFLEAVYFRPFSKIILHISTSQLGAFPSL